MNYTNRSQSCWAINKQPSIAYWLLTNVKTVANLKFNLKIVRESVAHIHGAAEESLRNKRADVLEIEEIIKLIFKCI